MRTDIILNNDDDLLIENKVNPYFNQATYEDLEAQYLIIAVQLNSMAGNYFNLQSDRSLIIDDYCSIEHIEDDKRLLMYFYHIDGSGIRTESPRLFVLNEKELPVTSSDLQSIDAIGYNVFYKEDAISSYQGVPGAYIIRTYEEGDFVIDGAIEQNEKFLLISNKGNILEHPMTGISLMRYMNGITDRDGLRGIVEREFLKDELQLTYFDVDSQTNVLEVRSKEMYDNI